MIGLPPFAGLSIVDCEAITSAARAKRFWRGQAVFYEGDLIKDIFVQLSGSIKLTQAAGNGTEVILRLVRSGEIVGNVVGCAQCCTARAIQKCVLLLWEAIVFERLLERFPTFRRNAMNSIQENLIEMEKRFWSASTQRIESRLSSELIRLTSKLERRRENQRKIGLSHAELAQLTGTDASTISRLLRRWQAHGIVAIQRRAVTVQNFDALARLAERE